MADNDVEIEIKIPLEEKDFLDIRKRLQRVAKYVQKLSQVDIYFTPIHRNFAQPKFPFESLRIRRKGDKSILNYKHFHPENVPAPDYCDEFETEIVNSGQLEKMLLAMNFRELVTVEKEREVYLFQDEFEIALDWVKELGYFIEIESVRNLGVSQTIRKKILEIAKELGVDISKEDKEGYPYMLMKKKGRT